MPTPTTLPPNAITRDMNAFQRLSQRRIPFWFAAMLLLVLDCLYHILIRHLEWPDAITTGIIRSSLLLAVFYASLRLDTAKLTITYLAIPYLLFLPGWLNTPTAIVMTGVFVYAAHQAITHTHCKKPSATLTVSEFVAFLLLLGWVNFSGSGGYGYQTPDYTMLNSRLDDLVQFEWPVHYGPDSNFVYYIGYCLPAATIGKLFGYATAIASLTFWTQLGVVLACRWVSLLSGWKHGVTLVLIIIFFGPMDAVGVLWIILTKLPASITLTAQDAVHLLIDDPDGLNFWASRNVGFFLGNFLSNTYQLYWAPQHIIPGWLCICLLTHLFLKKQFQHFLFVFALLCLWSPLVMLAMVLFPLFALLSHPPHQHREWLTASNLLAAPLLTLLFMLFYAGGSALTNPNGWTFTKIDILQQWDAMLLFYALTWGLYALAVIPHLRTRSDPEKIWFAALFLTFLLLPLYAYGAYNDLLCRGAAPIMFLLMVLLLQRLKTVWENQQRHAVACILCLILIGSGSALLQLYIGIVHYGDTREVIPITSYKYAKENLGDDRSIFARFLRGKVE